MFEQAKQQMEVKAFSMTVSLWPTWTRSEHLVHTCTYAYAQTHAHTKPDSKYVVELHPGVMLVQEYHRRD